MDRRMKAYTATLGACGLVGAAAMTDSGLPTDLRPPDGVKIAVERALGTEPASAGNYSSNSSKKAKKRKKRSCR